MMCLKKKTKFVNKKTHWYRALCPVHTAHSEILAYPHKVLMGGNLHLPPSLPPSLGTNGLSQHPGMVEIHTHVAAAPHLWVKEASKQQHRDGGTEGDIHTHNPYKVHKSS
jgi:hypothetical protein